MAEQQRYDMKSLFPVDIPKQTQKAASIRARRTQRGSLPARLGKAMAGMTDAGAMR
ncbi:hypothetical protein [Stutzerimonas stutzeri]|uniref:hypothetical protein n=1 Tax=Stutzerimonas stutzeri TaxID=316 RepID=UPI0034D499EF